MSQKREIESEQPKRGGGGGGLGLGEKMEVPGEHGRVLVRADGGLKARTMFYWLEEGVQLG